MDAKKFSRPSSIAGARGAVKPETWSNLDIEGRFSTAMPRHAQNKAFRDGPPQGFRSDVGGSEGQGKGVGRQGWIGPAERPQAETRNTASTSASAFSGRWATPTVVRACRPRAPRTSTMRSEAPFIAWGSGSNAPATLK